MLSVPALQANLRIFPLSRPVKFTVIGVTVGVTVLGFLARYLRRRVKPKPRNIRTRNPSWRSKGQSPTVAKGSADGDLRRSPSIAYNRFLPRTGSVSLASDVHSSSSTLTTTITGEVPELAPQQYGTMGMEALVTAISYWEDALAAYTPPTPTGVLAIPDTQEVEFTKQLEKVLQKSYHLRDTCEKLFLHQTSVLFQGDAFSLVSERMTDISRHAASSMSSESFVSAHSEQVADLREFDEFQDHSVDHLHCDLYQLALHQLEDGGIPYRIPLRTASFKCQSDVEYLAKLHCVRLAFQYLIKDDIVREWFIEAGRSICCDLLCRSDRDPKEFNEAFDEMLEYVEDEVNWYQIEEELKGRGVKCMSFYDVVLDFIFLDAFEDLESPPSSVVAVVQNRWLSNSFKETALSTAVWSVLKAKRRLLKWPNGFIAHFYAISEHISPVLAWGFLGPADDLTDVCHFFKDQVTEYLQDIFSFQQVHYTTIDELSSDIYKLARHRYELVSQRLSV